jgi:glycosyltransferase involved in cell wall biosynthesis
MQHRKSKILLFGYLPPPVFGPSVAYQSLMRSKFAQHFDVTFINLSVVTDIRELEKFHPVKVLKLAKFFLTELWYLLTRRFDSCCYPISYNQRAFLKDRVLIGLARTFRVPVVVWAHGTGLPRFRASLSPGLRRWLDAMLRNARGVIVLAECLRSEFGGLVATERIHVVPIGLEPQPDLPPPEPRGAGLRIVYLGALAGTKGIFDILAALPLVQARSPAAKLVCGGNWFKASEQATAEQFIHEHGLGDAAEFLGAVHGAAKWRLLRSADIFVFPPPSQNEAFGIVLLEAMQAGLPIVATRGGARSEIIADGVNGLLVEEQNPRDLAEKILRLANDPGLRESMGKANRERFVDYYTHEHYGRRMIAVFEELTKTRKFSETEDGHA